jgi:type I restriction-modification system DNA methylase subunit
MLLKMSKKSRDGLRRVLTSLEIMQGKEAVLPNLNMITNMLDDLDEQDARIAELEAEIVTMGEELAEYKKQEGEE